MGTLFSVGFPHRWFNHIINIMHSVILTLEAVLVLTSPLGELKTIICAPEYFWFSTWNLIFSFTLANLISSIYISLKATPSSCSWVKHLEGYFIGDKNCFRECLIKEDKKLRVYLIEDKRGFTSLRTKSGFTSLRTKVGLPHWGQKVGLPHWGQKWVYLIEVKRGFTSLRTGLSSSSRAASYSFCMYVVILALAKSFVWRSGRQWSIKMRSKQ